MLHTKEDIDAFVTEFVTKYNSLLNNVSRKYMIPNRYNSDDMKQYIAERMIQILTNRINSDNKIENPEKYFKSCLDFYCIEYQRMHGYIFDLPKRPRKNCKEDEAYIRTFGFKYLGDMSTDEYNSLIVEDNKVDEERIGEASAVWDQLMVVLTKEESDVLNCIFRLGLTWLETSKHLGVPQSTCWIRKDRAIEKIYKAFEKIDGELVNDVIKKFLRADPGVLGSFGSED